MSYTDEIRELIASNPTDRHETLVARISYSAFETKYLTGTLRDGQQVQDENGVMHSLIAAPLKIGDESGGEMIANSRKLTFQGVNDLIAAIDDQIDRDSDERVIVDVMTYVEDLRGNLSTIQFGPIRYRLNNINYSAKKNGAELEISTRPTNEYETGFSQTIQNFPSLRGLS